MKPRIILRYFDNSFVICTINYLILKNHEKSFVCFCCYHRYVGNNILRGQTTVCR